MKLTESSIFPLYGYECELRISFVADDANKNMAFVNTCPSGVNSRIATVQVSSKRRRGQAVRASGFSENAQAFEFHQPKD